MYPNTRLVEIHADKAARSRMSMLRNVPERKAINSILGNASVFNAPQSPMISADTTTAAHKPVKVVDARTNTANPL
jgi:uncharacterized Fe-S cluster protein YjdI